MTFFAELKRRRIFRVAGGYLVAAWLLLQVADVVFPALRLPPWTLTFVVVVLIIGFPIALILGWAFDLTPDGIERTVGRATDARFPLRALMTGSVIVAVGVFGFVVLRQRAIAAKVDANAVVVLPFRVLGDASLMVMREGMVDLMSAKLTGEGGPRALDSRTTLAAWRRAIESDRDDLAPLQAMQLARKLGAGQVLLGELVGAPGKLALNAKLYSSVTGSQIEAVHDTASADQVLQLVDRVVTKLLSQRAGEQHRLAALLSESLPAVRTYLEGRSLFRQSKHYEAAERFKAALAEDSTFALAGLGLALARSWAAYGPDYARGLTIAWRHRERLPAPDRAFLEAWAGKDYPRPQSARDWILASQQLTERYPDMVDAWFLLGDAYYHAGTLIDIENPIDKALAAWDRVLDIDSSFAPALEHQPQIHAERGDTASLRRVADMLFKRIQPEDRLTSDGAYVAARALKDEQWARDYRANLANVPAAEVRQLLVHFGSTLIPDADLDLFHEHLVAVSSGEAKRDALFRGSWVFLNLGRPGKATATARQIERGSDAQLIWLALVSGGELDTAIVAAAAKRQESTQLGTPADTTTALAHFRDQCGIEMWRTARGNLATVDASIARLRAFASAHPTQTEGWLVPCANTLDAFARVKRKSPDARAVVERLDSASLHAPLLRGWAEFVALMLVRAYTELGDFENALRASRRYNSSTFTARAALILERARLAARLGRRDEAIDAYREYLKLRAMYEPGTAAEKAVTEARNELARLSGEQSSK